ncbi:zinc finger BED domain-containing protein DAYSLEEPER-like, partial [Trifolium medium]|nr:zinc finger BED domain-containing protein DAYSLEEPER-like [Trifolium medium]
MNQEEAMLRARNTTSQGVRNTARQVVNEQGEQLMGPPSQSLPSQNMNEAGPSASTQAVGPELTSNQESKKRKANANGPRQTAPCWEYFIRLPDNEVDVPTAVCKLCHKRYLCHPRNHGTTNLNTHILKCPPILALKALKEKNPNQTVLTFPTVEGAGLAAVSSRFNQLACRKALATYIILDEQPFKTVEGEGFKHYSKIMQPLFNIPTRKTIANDCFQLYMDEKRLLKAFFKTDCSRVALTTDCWTSIQNLNYLTLTAHFVDNEW